ncbi:MAG: response regulator transcription factor [Bacteroidota bacterium]|jgi:DNA-binding NarL/FixJ family response regulator
MKIRCAIVEDNASFRKRFSELLSLSEDIKLVGSYATGEAAIHGVKKLPPSKTPHIVLMDIELPKMSGIETTEAIKEIFPEIEIMMLTVFEDETKIFDSIRAGASGYFLKDDSTDEIINAVKELFRGGAPMSQAIARKVLSFIQHKPTSGEQQKGGQSQLNEPAQFSLTDREIELLHGLVAGETYTALAKRLFISPHTVRTHIKNIYKKLHVHSRATAVRTAIERNLI